MLHLLDITLSVYQLPHDEVHIAMFTITDGDLKVASGTLSGTDPTTLYYEVLKKWVAWTKLYFGETSNLEETELPRPFAQLRLPGCD